jgi:hypothetical protein
VERIESARFLTSFKNMSPSGVRLKRSSFLEPGAFSTRRGNTREARVSVTFGGVNAPKVLFHGLGFVPSGFQILSVNKAASVYSDVPLKSTTQVIVLKCDTANTTADILVR